MEQKEMYWLKEPIKDTPLGSLVLIGFGIATIILPLMVFMQLLFDPPVHDEGQSGGFLILFSIPAVLFFGSGVISRSGYSRELIVVNIILWIYLTIGHLMFYPWRSGNIGYLTNMDIRMYVVIVLIPFVFS